jgi:hypothetical protein
MPLDKCRAQAVPPSVRAGQKRPINLNGRSWPSIPLRFAGEIEPIVSNREDKDSNRSGAHNNMLRQPPLLLPQPHRSKHADVPVG